MLFCMVIKYIYGAILFLQVAVDKQSSLLDVLKDPRFKVMGGTPAFIVLVQKSPFEIQFLSKYK